MALRLWARDTRGVAATEFALCLPFLALLYIGGFQLSDAISANRKVTMTARTLADLTSQATAVTEGDITTYLDASTQVLAPYKANAASLTISQIKIDSAGVSTVEWSRARNGTALTAGTPYTLPTAIKVADTWLIVATIDYTYTPVAASGLIGTIPMRDTIFMNPRAAPQVKFY